MSNSLGSPETLEDVRLAIRMKSRHGTVNRDCITALNSLERYSGTPLASIRLEPSEICDVFESVHPLSKGIKAATWNNIKSRCRSAIHSVLNDEPPTRIRRRQLSSDWQEVWNCLVTKSEKNVLSSLISYADWAGIQPQQVNDQVIAQFKQYLENRFRRNSDNYRRLRVKVWNKVRESAPELMLNALSLPAPQYRRKWILWTNLPPSFREEVQRHLHWASGANPFDPDARKKPLAPQSLGKRKQHLHAAADALVKTGVEIESITSLSDLLEPERVRQICRARFEEAGKRHTAINFELGRTLVEAAIWCRLPDRKIEEIRAITRLQKKPPQRMTEKNKATIRPFEDPELRQRLLRLPQLLIGEVRDRRGVRRHQLSKLHAALAIGILTFCPIRLGNLATLRFGEHIEIEGIVPSLRIPMEQVKNGQPLEFDIPPHFAALLREYRDVLCPKLTGGRHDNIFINLNGSAKRSGALGTLIKVYTQRYLGVGLNPHVFRHLAAKMILDRNPGAHAVVKDLLGHKNLETTASFYAGVDTKRAGRFHLALLMQAEAILAEDTSNLCLE
ncbi:MAG: site-specific integrase [Rhizobiaceae bacterium]